METLDERFRSRFEWGLIADISSPDYETRMAILHKKEEMEGYEIEEEILQYIANNIKSNIRELEGAFNKLLAKSRLEQKDINMELAEEVLKDFIYPNEKKPVTPEKIISSVADYYEVSLADLKGNKRNSKIVMPRQIAMYLCREITGINYTEIASLLGKKDHTTILYGIDKIDKAIKKDESLRNSIEILINKING